MVPFSKVPFSKVNFSEKHMLQTTAFYDKRRLFDDNRQLSLGEKKINQLERSSNLSGQNSEYWPALRTVRST